MNVPDIAILKEVDQILQSEYVGSMYFIIGSGFLVPPLLPFPSFIQVGESDKNKTCSLLPNRKGLLRQIYTHFH